MTDEDTVIRQAKRCDCETIRSLIQQLADFEKIPEGPKISYKDLEKHGFDIEPPLFMSYVATVQEKVVGYAIFYYTYSTWEGKSLFLEDLYISVEYRNKHVGSLLFNSVAQVLKGVEPMPKKWRKLCKCRNFQLLL